jgi:RNA-directed DNA polymerase
MVEPGGLFKEIKNGICRGCPLSPLIGAFSLTELDAGFKPERLFYMRYRDDMLILTKTRWKCPEQSNY